MRSASLPVLLVVVTVALAGCAPEVRVECDGLTSPKMLEAANLQYYWQINVALEEGENLTRLYLVGKDLYGLTDHARLLAMDATSGVWRWTVNAGGPGQRIFAPIHVDAVALPTWMGDGAKDKPTSEMIRQAKPFDAVMFNTLSHILVINRATGEMVMKIPLDFAVNTGGSAAPDGKGGCLYYLASVRGWCYAIDLRRALSVWDTSVESPVHATPVFREGVLFVADESGTLLAIGVDPNGPERLWNNNQIDSQRMAGAVTADMYIDDRGCFVPCEDNRLYAFDRLTGKPLWPPFICQGPLRDTPQVGENTIFQRTTSDRLYAVNVANGAQRWMMPTGRFALAVIRDKASQVYLLDGSNTLRVVEELTGTEIASLPMIGYSVYVPNVTTPAIYAASRGGRVVCIRPRGAEPLTSEKLKAASP
jgi:outer membrane protein assembly factor BamB